MKDNFCIALSALIAGFLFLVLFGMRIMDAFNIIFSCGLIGFVIWGVYKIMQQICQIFKNLFGKPNTFQNPTPMAPPPATSYTHITGTPTCSPSSQPLFPQSIANPYIPSQGNWMSHVSTKESSQDGSTIAIYDLSGNPLRLGVKNEKGSGGEGTVYELPMNPKFLVKIYKETTLRDSRKMVELRKRIEDMASLSTFAKTPFLAWPIMPAMNDRREVIGFVMRKCTGTSFLALRSLRGIQQHFPHWTRRELALTALDFVKKVRLLASQRVLVNDFNPSNFLMGADAKVSFIDCDSYQITGPHGINITRTYFPSHVAPELVINKSLLDRPRTIEQVEFGVALTVFNILMIGLHPYNYCDRKDKNNCATPEENLIKGRCPLGKDADCKFPKGNWYSMWSWLPYNLKATFIKMFKDGHSNPAARPSLETLQANLEELIARMDKDPDLRIMVPTKPRKQNSSTPTGCTAPQFGAFAVQH